MVSDKKVFPTKDSWVSLSRQPMIGDDKELEKIFKPHKEVCLLHLPPPEKKTVPRSKTGQPIAGDRATKPSFNEKDRLSFLEICGIRQLSQCVQRESQTENWRPCASMQSLVRFVIPYIQRFLHEKLVEVYSDLTEGKIAEKLKRLSFGQVGKLYVRYQLDVAGKEDGLIELQDVICLLKDEKELYIQKDHVNEKLEILSELVKLFCTESSHRKDLKQFLTILVNSNQKGLERLMVKDDIKELPSDEEQWEVPEPLRPETDNDRVFSRSLSYISFPEETISPPQPDGEQTLACWPPRASMSNTGSSHSGQPKSDVVDAVLKMWPPPPTPKDRDPEKEAGPGRRSGEADQTPRSSRPAELQGPQRVPSHPGEPRSDAATISSPKPSERSQQSETAESHKEEGREEKLALAGSAATPNPPSEPPAETSSNQPPPNSLVGPEAVVPCSTFQGTATAGDMQRPLLNMDFPQLYKDHSLRTTLEDMELPCQRPDTVVFVDEQMDLAAVGEWGEQLVNSFLCHWRDSSDPARPTHVLWCNQSGESGQPYDFKLAFGEAGAIFVEVKSTVKREKSFIHMSANELDFALKEKEHYHIYRVYSAGDAKNVRLCRIQNLAQHLHTKDLALFLFV